MRTTEIKELVRTYLPFDAQYNGQRGRVIGRQLDWPLFRPDNGCEDIELSWHAAERLRNGNTI